MRDSLKVGAIAGVVLVGAAALVSIKKPVPAPAPPYEMQCFCPFGHRFTFAEAKALKFAHHQNRIVCMEKRK
jgi:hypothetical protein